MHFSLRKANSFAETQASSHLCQGASRPRPGPEASARSEACIPTQHLTRGLCHLKGTASHLMINFTQHNATSGQFQLYINTDQLSGPVAKNVFCSALQEKPCSYSTCQHLGPILTDGGEFSSVSKP